MSAQGWLGAVQGVDRYEAKKQARLDRQREIELEDRKIGLENADRLRRREREENEAARQAELRTREDAEYERRQGELSRKAQEEGLDDLMRELDAGMPPEQAVRRFNSRGTSRITNLQFDPERRIAAIEEEDGTVSEVPIDAYLKSRGLVKEKEPEKPTVLPDGSMLIGSGGKVMARNPRDFSPNERGGGGGGGGGGKGDEGPKPLTAPQVRLLSNDAQQYVVGQLGGEWDSAIQRRVDQKPDVTERYNMLSGDVDRLVRKYGDRYLPREIGNLVLEAYGGVKSESEVLAEQLAAGKAPWHKVMGDYAGDDEETKKAIKGAAKSERQKQIQAAKARIAEIEARLDAEVATDNAKRAASGMSRDGILGEARRAVAAGKSRKAIEERLRAMGVDFEPSELD